MWAGGHAPSENLTVSVCFSFPALEAEHPRGPVALASCGRCCIPLQGHTCVGWKVSEGLGISEMGPGGPGGPAAGCAPTVAQLLYLKAFANLLQTILLTRDQQ